MYIYHLMTTIPGIISSHAELKRQLMVVSIRSTETYTQERQRICPMQALRFRSCGCGWLLASRGR